MQNASEPMKEATAMAMRVTLSMSISMVSFSLMPNIPIITHELIHPSEYHHGIDMRPRAYFGSTDIFIR